MRHKTTFPRRAAAFLLALLLAMPVIYADAGERKLQTSSEIVDGLTYRNTVTVNSGSRVESFALELSPDSEAWPILRQGSETIYTGVTINRAVSNAQAAGYHVVGAINTDFFVMSNGVPLGIVIEDGVYKSSNTNENAMAIVDGRVVIVDRPTVSLSLYDRASNITVVPNHFNKARVDSGGVYLLNGDFSTISTHSPGSGWYVRMKAVPDPVTGRAPDLTVNSALTLEVTELTMSNESLVIGPDEYILTAAEGAGRSDAYMAFQVGDLVTLTTSCDYPTISAAQWAGGVGDIMIRDGAVTDSSSWVYAKDGRQPRTAMGLKADGTVVLYAVDGRQSGYSIGLSQVNLADELLRQGCVTAVNLDGGGSTSFSLWIPGQNGPAVRNKPSGGSLRACATYLLLVTGQGSGSPRKLAPNQTGQVVLTGSSLPLPGVSVTDEVLNPVSYTPQALTYSSLSGLGTISGSTYTAGWTPGTDTIRVLSGDGLEGAAQIHVVNALSSFRVSLSGSTSALSSLQVKPGEQVQLTVSGTYWGRNATFDFSNTAVSVQGNVGTVDKNGLFTAAQNLGSGGTLTFSAGGLTQTVTVSSAYTHNDVTSDHWAYDAVEYCYSKGICSGISSTEFGRDYSITRGDFILMLYNAMGKPAVNGSCTFSDVASTDHFATALAWGQQSGLASGVGDNKFAPRDSITREQAFSLLYRFLPIAGKSVPDGALTVLDQFNDKASISDFAKTASATLVAQGLASGSDGRLDPKGTLTRAQMASLLYRVLEHTPVNTDPTTPSQPEDNQPTLPGDYLLALDQSQVTLASGGSVTLNAIILPAVTGANITWTSSDPAAAVVSSGGMVTNLHPGAGNKTVTVTASWNGQTVSCAVVCQQAQHAGTVTGADNGLNVRSGPGTTYAAIGGLRDGAQAVVLNYQDGWYQILFRNVEGQAAIGYVTEQYFTLDR